MSPLQAVDFENAAILIDFSRTRYASGADVHDVGTLVLLCREAGALRRRLDEGQARYDAKGYDWHVWLHEVNEMLTAFHAGGVQAYRKRRDELRRAPILEFRACLAEHAAYSWSTIDVKDDGAVTRLDLYARALVTTDAGRAAMRSLILPSLRDGAASVRFDSPKPGSDREFSVHLRRDAGIYTACGERIRQANDPKFDADGKPLRLPVIGFTYRTELASCGACRTAQGLGPWSGRIVPWDADLIPINVNQIVWPRLDPIWFSDIKEQV